MVGLSTMSTGIPDAVMALKAENLTQGSLKRFLFLHSSQSLESRSSFVFRSTPVNTHGRAYLLTTKIFYTHKVRCESSKVSKCYDVKSARCIYPNALRSENYETKYHARMVIRLACRCSGLPSKRISFWTCDTSSIIHAHSTNRSRP